MQNAVQLSRTHKRLNVTVTLAQPAEGLVIRLHSDRNQPVSRYSDVSPRAKDNSYTSLSPENAGEVWFPVIDFALDARFSAELRFAPGTAPGFTLNGVLNGVNERTEEHTHKPISVAAHALLEWENCFFVPDRRAALTDFVLVVRVPIVLSVTKQLQIPLRLLSEHWAGRVSVAALRAGEEWEVGEATLAATPPPRRSRGTGALDRQSLLDALSGCVAYLLSSGNDCAHSPFAGGFYLLYDLDARTYRQPAWLWGWGPAIRALLKCLAVPEIQRRFPAERLLNRACAAGEATLVGLVRHDDPLLDGLCTARWDPNPAMPGGMRERINVAADSGFLCGWAWSALYAHTQDARYLEAGLRYIETTERFLRQYPVPPQDYWPEAGRFSAHTLDESGFGVEAHAALYQLTGQERIREQGRTYIDRHIEAFERPDGLWERSFYWQDGHTDPTIRMTRGLGWAMEGLLAAFEMTREHRYLEKACRLADHLLRAQTPSGCWAFVLDKSPDAVGYDDKGTPLWSLLLYRLHRATGDPAHLSAARRALAHCVAHQLVEGETECIGALPGATPHSGIVYRPWFDISCLYASGFFALALLEELEQPQ